MSEFTKGDFGIIYLGVFLAPPETKMLQQLCFPWAGALAESRGKIEGCSLGLEACSGPAHVTLAFRPEDKMAYNFRELVGKYTAVRGTGYAKDEKALAAIVDSKAMEQYVKKMHHTTYLPMPVSPHITLALAPGVPPKYSNELLEKEAKTGNFWSGLGMMMNAAGPLDMTRSQSLGVHAIELMGRFGYVAAMPAGGNEIFFTPEHLPSRG